MWELRAILFKVIGLPESSYQTTPDISNLGMKTKCLKSSPGHVNCIATSWLPYTLRRSWFCVAFTYTCLLGIAVVVVHIISWRNSGLTTDDGSGIVQIGSKFVPTLLATIYVFIASILLDDVKRTEPFARLSSPTGAQAAVSISWTAYAWWDTLFSSLPSHQRKTNWALLCATLAFVLGFLILSPLSSSLIVSQAIVLTQETAFRRLNIKPSMPINVEPSSETFYRTIGSSLRNVTTSAWISDKYAILPFWPASLMNAPLGPVLFETDQTWTATTSVFSTDLSCEPMELMNITDAGLNIGGIQLSRYAYLSTPGACQIGYGYGYRENGAVLWSYPGSSHTKLFFVGGLDPLVATPSCTHYDEYFVTAITSPETVIVGEACKMLYYVGDSVATVKRINGHSVVEINESQYHANRRPISPTAVNISSFQDAFLSRDWSKHLSISELPVYNAVGKPIIEGPANLLAALYDFSPDRVMAELPEKRRDARQRIEGRFFGELWQDVFNNNNNAIHEPDEAAGLLITSPRRLIVVSAVAFTLEAVLLVILALLLIVFTLTRLSRRPLGLITEPDTSISIAKLLSDDTTTMQSFLDVSTGVNEKSNFTSFTHRYRMEHGKLRLISWESAVASPGRENAAEEANIELDQRSADLSGVGRSTVFNIWSLGILIMILTTVLTAILTLYIYSREHKLYQKAFVYTISMSITGVNLGDVNPTFILITLTRKTMLNTV